MIYCCDINNNSAKEYIIPSAKWMISDHPGASVLRTKHSDYEKAQLLLNGGLQFWQFIAISVHDVTNWNRSNCRKITSCALDFQQ